MLELGVNIDHIATLRQARMTVEPDPVWAAVLAELGGADCITVHLREDRRHIQDNDVALLRKTVRCKLNLEMASTVDIARVAFGIKPDQATLVPENREEVTTEGGLDVAGSLASTSEIVRQLQEHGISVSLFLDPDPRQIEAGLLTACNAIEIHTGQYALAEKEEQRNSELQRILECAELINASGIRLHAGHGLTYRNVLPIASIPGMRELNIGHSIISRALMTGLKEAVGEMKRLLKP